MYLARWDERMKVEVMERKLEGCLFLKIDQQQRMKTVEMKFVMLRIHVSTLLISDVAVLLLFIEQAHLERGWWKKSNLCVSKLADLPHNFFLDKSTWTIELFPCAISSPSYFIFFAFLFFFHLTSEDCMCAHICIYGKILIFLPFSLTIAMSPPSQPPSRYSVLLLFSLERYFFCLRASAIRKKRDKNKEEKKMCSWTWQRQWLNFYCED